MAGKTVINQLQLGDSATATQNFVLQTNVDGTAKLARGNAGATTQDILTVDTNGKVTFPLGTSTGKLVSFSQTVSGVLTKYTFTHNLGTKDIWFFGYLECTTSGNGYSVGDRVPLHMSTGNQDSFGVSAYIDSINTVTLFVRSAGFGVNNKATFAPEPITVANWKIVLFVRPVEG